MLSVFPDGGDVTAVDTARDVEFPLSVHGRRVEGLTQFFEATGLDVNDEILIRPLEDGRFGFTAQKRDRRPDFTRPDVMRRLLDDIVATVPVTEQEIRALHPDLPNDFPLRRTLEAEPRLAFFEGRWQSRLVVEAHQRAVETEAQRRLEEARRRADAAEREEAQRRVEAAEREAAERAAAEREAAEKRAQHERERLNQQAADDARSAAQRERVEREALRELEAEDAKTFGTAAERFDWDQPVARSFRLPWQRQKGAKEAPVEPVVPADPLRLDRLGEARPAAPRPTVMPAPRSGLFPGDAALNSESLPVDPAKTKRAREAFAALGYRIEGLAHGQLMLHADLGRRQYRTLLHVLPDGERLDWAALLARRRDANAKYLAVVGDHRDLHRLTAPADLARATLWSWAGLDRVMELSRTVTIGALDLEPHFERDGMFEYGLERFERSVAKRVQERGTLSTVLTALAALRAPTVFVLDDLTAHGDVPRDQIVRILERLSEAPFHLVTKVDSGEFCLRYRVHDALDQLGAYATSLRARLPERQRERIRGIPEGLDPIGGDDVPAAEGVRAPVPVPVRANVVRESTRETPREAPRPAPRPQQAAVPADARPAARPEPAAEAGRTTVTARQKTPKGGSRPKRITTSPENPTGETASPQAASPQRPTVRDVIVMHDEPSERATPRDQRVLFTGPGFSEDDVDDEVDLSVAARKDRPRKG